MRRLIRAFASCLNILWLLSYWPNIIQFLSLKEDCTGLSESTFVKMPHCWKSHVTAQILYFCKINFILQTVKIWMKWASTRENLSSRFPKWSYPNQPAQLQRLPRNWNFASIISLYMILSNKQITKALIRLWSVTSLFANHRRQVFSHRGPNGTYSFKDFWSSNGSFSLRFDKIKI